MILKQSVLQNADCFFVVLYELFYKDMGKMDRKNTIYFIYITIDDFDNL